jgi:hypothetical protein
MDAASEQEKSLIDKIRALPAEQIDEVEDFVDFLRERSEDRRLTRAAATLSQPVFAQIWDNADDAEYDQL